MKNTTKHLVTLFAIFMAVSVNAQWSFNGTSGNGIESSSNTASGPRSIAMGSQTTASGRFSTTMGDFTLASGVASTAMGENTAASGTASTAMGGATQASGQGSTAMGYFTIASGDLSTAMGFATTASDYGTLAIGQFNTDDATLNPFNFDLENRAFIIGNGTNSNKSDAMAVLFDGTTTIAGSVTATSFIGDGSLLTNLPSGSDDQQLSLDANSLILEDGGSVDLLGYLDNTDNQNISGSLLTGTTLTIAIEGGTSENIDLNPLLVNLQAQIDAQQIIIDDLIVRMIIQEGCKCNDNFNGNGDRDGTNRSFGDGDSNAPSNGAFLINNIPNPFENSTSIAYFVPITSNNANIVISSSTGQILKNIPISEFGKGSVVVNKDKLNAAIYYYTLYVDGKQIDTKKMIVK